MSEHLERDDPDRCQQVDDPYYGGKDSYCVLRDGHTPKVCVSFIRGREVWWTA